MNKKLIAAAAVIALGAWAGLADARSTEEPKKANKIQGTMVRAYDECSGATNDTTAGGLPLPACAPSVTSDTTCDLEALKGSAKIDLKEKKGLLEGGVKISKLQNCEGEELCLLADARVTTDNCSSGNPEGCTVSGFLTERGGVNPDGFATGMCCTVVNGGCKVKIGLNEALGSAAVTPGNVASITIGRLMLQRTGGGNVLGMGLLSR